MGIVLWELLARQRLMTGESAANTLHRLMNEPIPRVSQVVPNIDPELDAIVAKALEKDPQYRWQSAMEMRDALEAWLRANPRPARQEEVGRKMLHLFSSVREEVQRQVQRHMAGITAATTTQELQALNAESLHRMEQSGANVSGQLLRLGSGSGSGSGVVPNYGMGSHPSQASQLSAGYAAMGPQGAPSVVGGHVAPPPAPARGNNTLLIVLAVGFFLLAGLLIVVVGLRDRRKQDGPVADPTGAPATGTVVAGNPSAPVVPGSAAPVETASPTAPPVDSATAAPQVPTSAKTSVRNPPTPPTTRTQAVAHPPPPPPPPVEDKDPGFLTINVYPWAEGLRGRAASSAPRRPATRSRSRQVPTRSRSTIPSRA